MTFKFSNLLKINAIKVGVNLVCTWATSSNAIASGVTEKVQTCIELVCDVLEGILSWLFSLFAQKFEKACKLRRLALTNNFKWQSNEHCEVIQDWNRDNFVISKHEPIDFGSGLNGAKKHLYYRQCTEGDLSRLYLRVMYGLAEFAGVPIKEEPNPQIGTVWNSQHQYFGKYYPVSNKLNNRVSKSSFPFGLLCDQALNAAKQGEAAKIQQVLGTEALRRAFMELGLIHHSSDGESTAVVIKPFGPHTINGNYQREEYECEQDDHINNYGRHSDHSLY